MEDRLEWIWVSNSSEARSGSIKKSDFFDDTLPRKLIQDAKKIEFGD